MIDAKKKFIAMVVSTPQASVRVQHQTVLFITYSAIYCAFLSFAKESVTVCVSFLLELLLLLFKTFLPDGKIAPLI